MGGLEIHAVHERLGNGQPLGERLIGSCEISTPMVVSPVRATTGVWTVQCWLERDVPKAEAIHVDCDLRGSSGWVDVKTLAGRLPRVVW